MGVAYPLYLNAIRCGKGVEDFVSLLLQKESIMLVSDFTWNFNEACPIKFDHVKTTRIVKKSFDNLHPSSSSETKHAIYIQFIMIPIDSYLFI